MAGIGHPNCHQNGDTRQSTVYVQRWTHHSALQLSQSPMLVLSAQNMGFTTTAVQSGASTFAHTPLRQQGAILVQSDLGSALTSGGAWVPLRAHCSAEM